MDAHNDGKIHEEAGIAAILYVIVVMLFVSAVMSLIVARMDDLSHQKLLQTQALYLQHAQQQLQSWYQQNAAFMDNGNSAPPFSASAILESAGIQSQWNAQLFVSDESCSTTDTATKLCYRMLWLAVPAVSGAEPTYTNGVFQPGASQYVEISGEAIETALYNQALQQLHHFGTLLESGFAASESSGALHNVNVDWFAPNNCEGGIGDGPFACSQGGFISWTDYTQGSGIAGTDGNNPWGIAVEVNNSGGDASDSATPYTVELQSPLPWGGALTTLISQPL